MQQIATPKTKRPAEMGGDHLERALEDALDISSFAKLTQSPGKCNTRKAKLDKQLASKVFWKGR